MDSPQNLNTMRIHASLLVALAASVSLGMVETLPIAIYFVAFAGILVLASAALFRSEPHYPIIALLLIFFFFFPYESVNPTVRATGEYFSMYRRLIGPFHTWHLFLFWSLLMLGAQQALRGDWRFRGIPVGFWLLILGFYVFMFLWGGLHIRGNVLSYGYTDTLRPFVSFQIIVTMFMTYFITANSIRDKTDLELVTRILRILFIALTLYGIVRSVLILAGIVQTTWIFGLPIILYDQMVLLYLAIGWGLAEYLIRADKPAISKWVLMIMILLILTSTRRFNYIILFLTGILTFAATRIAYPTTARALLRRAATVQVPVALTGILLILLVPSWWESVMFSIQSINFLKNNEFITNSDVRRFALMNLFQNMQMRPYSWLVGFGLGTTWKPIGYQPLDVTYLSVNAAYLAKSVGWLPQFSLPYLSLFFRYGIAGALFYWMLCTGLAFSLFQKLKRASIPARLKPLGIGGTVFILLFLPTIGDGFNPTAPILLGFLIGYFERLVELYPAENHPTPGAGLP